MIPRERVVVPAPAKVNLCLHVGDRRADGYHDLESLVAFAALADEIELTADESFALAVEGPFAGGLPTGEDNLVLRAARLLAERVGHSTGVRIRLTKNIPVAAGLGGGSADAAAVLRGLPRLWQCDREHCELTELAARLGADVPVCLPAAPSWMEGLGERVTRVPDLPECFLLLVNPGVPVATAKVFGDVRRRRGVGGHGAPPGFRDLPALLEFLRQTGNDLEEPACAIAPAIGDVLDEIACLPGALLARMSGSGATCFGIFADEQQSNKAAAALRALHPAWWAGETGLLASGAAAPRTVQSAMK